MRQQLHQHGQDMSCWIVSMRLTKNSTSVMSNGERSTSELNVRAFT